MTELDPHKDLSRFEQWAHTLEQNESDAPREVVVRDLGTWLRANGPSFGATITLWVLKCFYFFKYDDWAAWGKNNDTKGVPASLLTEENWSHWEEVAYVRGVCFLGGIGNAHLPEEVKGLVVFIMESLWHRGFNSQIDRSDQLLLIRAGMGLLMPLQSQDPLPLYIENKIGTLRGVIRSFDHNSCTSEEAFRFVVVVGTLSPLLVKIREGFQYLNISFALLKIHRQRLDNHNLSIVLFVSSCFFQAIHGTMDTALKRSFTHSCVLEMGWLLEGADVLICNVIMASILRFVPRAGGLQASPDPGSLTCIASKCLLYFAQQFPDNNKGVCFTFLETWGSLCQLGFKSYDTEEGKLRHLLNLLAPYSRDNKDMMECIEASILPSTGQ